MTSPGELPNLRILDHPLIQRKLTVARDRQTESEAFRRLLDEIAGLMTFESSRHIPTRRIEVRTPLETTEGVALDAPITLVAILRAGLSMTNGILALVPEARVGHIGVYRDEKTLEAVPYYLKLPPGVERGPVLLVDPMLATGGSAVHAATELRRRGCTDIVMICLVAAPEGVRRMAAEHPDVTIFAAALDRGLDERGFIRPGLGDAGDRIFHTM